jgi:calcineurin-like phosphoesterase family protein
MSVAGLYKTFDERWGKQAIWIYSDTHFNDEELAAGTPNRPDAETQIKNINSKVGKYGTLILLGDVGDIECARRLKGYKILVMGNHDSGRTNYERKIIEEKFDYAQYTKAQVLEIMRAKYPNWKISIDEAYSFQAPFHYYTCQVDNCLFDEVYEGPLFIGEKLLISHEPLNFPNAVNIHGHVHSKTHKNDQNHLNVCSDFIGYEPQNLNQLVKSGLFSKIETTHRATINKATQRAKKRGKKK